jgi:hypothetical protein
MILWRIAHVLTWCCLVPISIAASTRTNRCDPIKFLRGGDDHAASTSEFVLVRDQVIHDGWRRLIRRTVRLPSSLLVDFEIVGQRGTDQAVLVFVWNSQTKTATLIREYMPALHQRVLGLAAGMVEAKHDDDKKETDIQLTAAEHELEEECRMKGGTWYKVTNQDSAMDKYSSTKLAVYLVIDPEPVPADQALARDETEEGMQVIPGVTIPQLLELVVSGQLTVVGGWACLLAIHKLKELGEID